jgi:murein DD-endopeptidase MepM/ murein hydrolase activator NlpD
MRPPGRLGNGNIRLIFPLSIPAPISSIFGWRMHPITGDMRFHSGTDLAAPIGTPVLAAYAGQVALADFLGGYGLAVAIDHTQGTQQTLYGHLSEIFVKSGDVVKQGDVIGRVGSTGNSTGPHLHFEFRQLTSEGWVALDAGAQLEYALAQLVNSVEVAQATSAPIKANAGVQGVIQ